MRRRIMRMIESGKRESARKSKLANSTFIKADMYLLILDRNGKV